MPAASTWTRVTAGSGSVEVLGEGIAKSPAKSLASTKVTSSWPLALRVNRERKQVAAGCRPSIVDGALEEVEMVQLRRWRWRRDPPPRQVRCRRGPVHGASL